MSRALLLGLVVIVLVTTIQGIKVPAGCTYDTGLFTCNYKNFLPVHGLDFSPPPQRLIVENVFGSIRGVDFFNFSSVNVTAFDINFDATLTLKCHSSNAGKNGYLTLVDSSFVEMDFYQNVLIRDCNIEHLPGTAFQHLKSLNFLGFEGGYINVMDSNAFANLTITADPLSISPKGELSFFDVDIISGGFHESTLAPLSSLEILTIHHSRISNFLDDSFANLHKVHTLNLDDNTFTYVRKAVFRNMTALSRVTFSNINWQCTCKNLWFIDKFQREGISIDSEVVCNEPAAWEGIRAEDYKVKICDESICDGGNLPAVDLGVVCLTYLQIAIYCMACLGFILVPVISHLCMAARSKAAKMEGKGIRTMTPRRPPPRQRAPMAHARGFPAAKQNMYGQGGGMSYPSGSFA